MSNEKYQGSDRKNLLLAFVAGICGDQILSAMTMSEVTFSIFPWIALIVALEALYSNYIRRPMAEDFPMIGLACFFIGAFGHSAFLKMDYPHEGTNIFSIFITLALLVWVGKKIGCMSNKTA
ncbi:YijD family membrane protein [Vibrio sp. RC27]